MNNGYVPTSSPVSRAIEATDKAVANEQRILKKASVTRVETAIHAIEKIGDLSVYNPTERQCASMLEALRDAVSKVEQQFKTIQPRQITFSLE